MSLLQQYTIQQHAKIQEIDEKIKGLQEIIMFFDIHKQMFDTQDRGWINTTYEELKAQKKQIEEDTTKNLQLFEARVKDLDEQVKCRGTIFQQIDNKGLWKLFPSLSEKFKKKQDELVKLNQQANQQFWDRLLK